MAIIFDLDGTLVNSRASIIAALSHAFHIVTGDINDFECFEVGPPLRTAVRDVIACDLQVERVLEEFKYIYDKSYFSLAELYLGVADVLMDLSEDHSLVLATNKRAVPTYKILEHLGLIDLFDDVIAQGHGAEVSKLENIRSSSIDLSVDSYLIGDTWGDMETALKLGCTPIFCDWGYGDKPAEQVRIAERPSELLTIIRSKI